MTSDHHAHEAAAAGSPGVHTPTLYYSTYSLYSILVRHALQLGRTLDSDSAPDVRLHLVDMLKDEHLGEAYLKVNPMGQVPALRLEQQDGTTKLLADSSEILEWLCAAQPGLMPDEHRQEIQTLLDSFYSFHAKPLTIRPEERNDGITNKAAAMLERTDISESHRRSLEVKSVYHDTKFRTTLDPETIETTEAQARDFIRSISSLVRRRQEQAQQSGESSGIYIFGSKPCVADAVATALLARLIDVGRDDLFDDAAAKDYTSRVRQSDEWKAFMQDRRTVPGA